MTEQEHRDLDRRIAEVRGYRTEQVVWNPSNPPPLPPQQPMWQLLLPDGIVAWHDGDPLSVVREFEEERCWLFVPRYSKDPAEAVGLLKEGVERHGGVRLSANMEEWDGDSFSVAFYDSPAVPYAPFCVAVCQAFLKAAESTDPSPPL